MAEAPKFEDTLPVEDQVEAAPRFEDTTPVAAASSQENELNYQPQVIGEARDPLVDTVMKTGTLIGSTEKPKVLPTAETRLSGVMQGLRGMPELDKLVLDYTAKKMQDQGIEPGMRIKGLQQLTSAMSEALTLRDAQGNPVPVSDTLEGAAFEMLGGAIPDLIGMGLASKLPGVLSKASSAFSKARAIKTAEKVRQTNLSNVEIAPTLRKAIQEMPPVSTVVTEATDPKNLRLVTPEAKRLGNVKTQLATLKKEIDELEEIESTIRANIETRKQQGLPTTDAEEALQIAYENRRLAAKQAYDTLYQPIKLELEEAKKFFTEKELQGAPILSSKVSSQGIVIPNSEVRELVNTADLSTLSKTTDWSQDPMRLAAQVDNHNPEGIMQATVRKISEADGVMGKEKELLIQQMRELEDKLGVRTATPERKKLIARYAEKRLTPEEIAAARITDNELAWVNETKRIYNSMFDRINEARITNGLKPIKKRQNYITHIIRENQLAHMDVPEPEARIGSLLGRGVKFVFGKERKSPFGSRDLMESLEAYIPSAMKQIHMTGPIAELEARTALLKPNAQKVFGEYAHIVKGGMDLKNQAANALFGRKVVQTVADLAALTSQSAVQAVNVVLQQPAQMVETLARTGMRSSVKGVMAAASKEIPEHLQKFAPTVVRRSIASDIRVNPTIFKKFDKFLDATLGAGDQFFAKQTWWSAFEKYKAKGYSEETAARLANDMSRMLHADYREIMRVGISRGKVGRIVQPVANFAYNLFNHIAQDPKLLAKLNNTSKTRELVATIGSMIAANQMYDFAGLPPPFQVSLPQGTSPGDIIHAGKETARLYPPVSFYQFGATPLAVKSAGVTPDELEKNVQLMMTAFLHDDEEKQKEAWDKLGKKSLAFLPYGRQLKNIWEGVEAVREKSINVGHEPVSITGKDKILAPLIGPNQLKKVRNERRRQAVEAINAKLGKEE